MTIEQKIEPTTFFANVWQGNYSVAQHFWLLWAMPMAGVKLIAKLVEPLIDNGTLNVNTTALYALVLIVAWITIMVVGGVGLRRSIIAQGGWTFWRVVADAVWSLHAWGGLVILATGR
jgi:hypothetical protein